MKKDAVTFGFNLNSGGNFGGRSEGGSGIRGGATSSNKLLIVIVSGLIYSALFGFAQPAKAEGPKSPGDSYSVLVDFAQRIAGEQPKLAAAARQPKSSDDSYSVLADFVHLIAGEQPKLIAAAEQPKSPDDSYSALADFVQRIGVEQPKLVAAAEQPKPVKAIKPPKTNKSKLPDGAATYVGAQACMTCHIVQAEDFGKTLMGRIFLKNPRNHQERLGCESCHGPGSEHVKAGGGRGVGGLIAFRNDSPQPVEERNAVCLTCHESSIRTYWKGSQHETRGLACTNCHQVMKKVSVKNQFVKSTELETCFQCHKDRRMQAWRSSHMPVREGKLQCSSCHNPHGTPNLKLLKENTPNESCYNCHAEKRGPFLWEHAPVRENCLNCHDPHGSIHDKLLLVSRPRLCQQCHSESGHPSSPQNPASFRAFNRGCANCHGGMIHGSNAPSGVRLHR